MTKIFTILCAFFLLIMLNSAYAQQRIITGKVTSGEDGGALPGVNITVKGATSGTVSDIDGSYRINVPADATTLVFSFIGFKRVEVLIGNRTEINQVLQVDTRQLNEVVVTSFGIKKEKKELGYAIQEIKGDEVAETVRPNVVNALQGRIAGVTVGTTGGLPGSSSAIIIRGATSLGSNNQPLFVIDGVPVSNNTLSEGLLLNDAPNRNADYTNRIADLNPNDIENITVLKGPAAAALYGIDAAAGAIIITTKQGAKGKTRIDYTGNIQFERITRFPELQDVYGFSSGAVGSVTGSAIPNTVIGAWGARIPEGTARFDNLRSVFGWGFNNVHNVNVSGGNETFTYNVSANVLRQNGSIPNTAFGRNTFKMSNTAQLSKKLKLTTSINYINSNTDRSPVTKGVGSVYYNTLLYPSTRDINNWQNDAGGLVGVVPDANGDGTSDDVFDNPNFNAQRNRVKDVTNRFILNGSLSYDVTDWFNIVGRIGTDWYNTFGQTVYDPQSWARFPNRSVSRVVGGILSEYEEKSRIINSFLLFNFKKKFGEFNTGLTLGHNIFTTNYRVDSRYGEGFLVPDLPSISNTNNTRREQATRGTRRNLVGVFGEFKVDYKNMVFLSVTGRNDWSSTLPVQNRSFFYPSVTGSVVLSELFDIDPSGKLSFAKIRANYAQVGKDAPPHQVLPALQEFIRTGGGYNIGFFGPNPNIVPETTTSYELGLDMKFFNNRFGIDFTYYRLLSKNQITQPRLSYASGYILQLVNAGQVENRGVELMITGTPIRQENFTWDIIANFALNRNKVLSLPGDFTEFYLSDTWLAGGARAGYVPGESILTITGQSIARDANGNALIGANGFPVRDLRYLLIGNRQPLFNLGITNSLKYKNFSLSFLFDIRVGGDIFNGTDWALTNFGLSKRTLDRGTRRTFEGVRQADGQPNTQEVELTQAYFSNYLGGANPAGLIEEQYIEKNIRWLRLRDITFRYSMPRSLFADSKFIKNIDLNLTGTNLWLLTNYTGADPDVNGLNASARGSGAVGFDYFSVPAPIAVAFGVKVGF
jgi:TonB-linked SusC/RagA family outer membrane protein